MKKLIIILTFMVILVQYGSAADYTHLIRAGEKAIQSMKKLEKDMIFKDDRVLVKYDDWRTYCLDLNAYGVEVQLSILRDKDIPTIMFIVYSSKLTEQAVKLDMEYANGRISMNRKVYLEYITSAESYLSAFKE